MNMKPKSAAVLFFACCLFTGCSALSSDGTTLSKTATNGSGQPESSPVFRAQNHRQWIMRLKIAKPIESLKGRAATQGASTSLPIPLPPTSLEQYALVVDQHQKLAWLRGSNNYGPFPLSNPDVTHLMNSVAAAYQEQAAFQASIQQTAMLQANMRNAAMQQQASVSSEFQSGQQAGMASFDGSSADTNQGQPAWDASANQQVKQSNYASEFDGF